MVPKDGSDGTYRLIAAMGMAFYVYKLSSTPSIANVDTRGCLLYLRGTALDQEPLGYLIVNSGLSAPRWIPDLLPDEK
jgi:hypothetical protein